ncbi:MAG: SDR family NAD(P)-dependent oxidoreductase [Epsilonproteobacteria bacterium]|nr:SDR family NAD(P)-dependent oxidoreductase [Campylobacterota bacterium]
MTHKTILITGSTDGIGLETAKLLASKGHKVLVHGRDPKKLEEIKQSFGGKTLGYISDFSNLDDIKTFAEILTAQNIKIDVLINNAGVYKTANPITQKGLDVRFVVNTIAPYYLTKLLTPLLHTTSRVINLSSAAQATVNIDALMGRVHLADGDAYAQSKLALTMITFYMAQRSKTKISSFIAVNPASLLGTKMVKEGYGINGKDISIGSGILARIALDATFSNIKGDYFDNDIGRFSPSHPDGDDLQRAEEVITAIESLLPKS